MADKYRAMRGCVLLLCIAGCSRDDQPQTFPVSGRVLLANGSALNGGTIELESQQTAVQYNAKGIINSDGAFQLTTFRPNDGAVSGLHKALVRPLATERNLIEVDDAALPASLVARKYQRYETSGLTVTISESETNDDVTIRLDQIANR